MLRLQFNTFASIYLHYYQPRPDLLKLVRRCFNPMGSFSGPYFSDRGMEEKRRNDWSNEFDAAYDWCQGKLTNDPYVSPPSFKGGLVFYGSCFPMTVFFKFLPPSTLLNKFISSKCTLKYCSTFQNYFPSKIFLFWKWKTFLYYIISDVITYESWNI